MWRGMYQKQSVVVLCLLGIVAAGEPSGTTSQNPNEMWITSEHLSPDWRYMELTTTCANPAKPEYAWIASNRSILFVGEVNVIDPNGLIGLSTLVTDARVVYGDGNSVGVLGASVSPLSYEPLS